MPLYFGTVGNIHDLRAVGLKGPHQEPMRLGYRTETKCFLLGYSVRDAGYVLEAARDTTHYYVLKQEKIPLYQKQGLLPTPLPPYSLSIRDYAFGYALWIFLGIALLYQAIHLTLIRRRHPGRQTPRA